METTYGARARIELHDPSICIDPQGSRGLSAAFAMLAAKSAIRPDDTDANAWAQVGYARTGPLTDIDHNDSGFHYFAQFTKECKLRQNCGTGVSPFRTTFVGSPQHGSYYDVYLRSADDAGWSACAAGLTVNSDGTSPHRVARRTPAAGALVVSG